MGASSAVPTASRYRNSVGTSAGSIIATIITVHIARNCSAPANQVSPGLRIHTIDIVQPPGIGMPMSDMDPHHAIVAAALAVKMSAATARNLRIAGSWKLVAG